MASCSTTSSIPKSFRYDVFLSFAGEDTRYEFIGHLYRALTSNKIETYKDDEKIKKGERISDQLLKAIEDSRFHIIVFSKSYAASSWCLDELVKIMECHNNAEQTAYPVFFDVEPTEVRKQSGEVGVAFAKHENKEAANKWRHSLKEAAAIVGWELKKIDNGDESKLIQIIVEEIQQKLHSINFQVDGELVGMETRIKDFVSSMETDLDDVHMIGISGMGGAGKTTLARAVFDRISINFEGQSFVENVREVSDSVLGLKSLQNQILSDVFNGPKLTVSSVSGGKNMMIRMMRCRKVLLVLDDVSDIKQLQALAGAPNWFKEGSRIIITTRDKQVLVAHGVNPIRDVNLLTHGEAICLFSKNAFGGDIPIPEFQELSEKVVHYAAGLPLTIKVLGSLLCGAELLDWKSALERLKTIPLHDTLQTLKLSYDGLEEDYKEIFLDVACILKGWEKEKAVEVLESCGFHARNGLRILEQKSLITVSLYGKLGMHDHIEEMGKYIVRQSHRSEPNRHSRLWIQKEIEDVLTNDSDTDAIQCIKMVWISDNHLEGPFMRRLGNMKKLRVLHINEQYSKVPGQCFPKGSLMRSLRYLRWDGYPYASLLKSFQADNLVGLTLQSSKIMQFWNSGKRKVLHNLRFLDMRASMLRTFDLGMTPNIEMLNLASCPHLVELNMPFGCSKQIKALYLKFSGLRTLNLAPTPDLETLDLEGCKDLAALTMPYQCLKLKFLRANSSKLKTLNLAPTPDLETLDLRGCKDLAELTMPYQCPKLKFLRADSSKLKTLDLRLISNLETVHLEYCHELVELQMPNDCPMLKALYLNSSNLRSLNHVSAPNLVNLCLFGCNGLVELHMPPRCPKLKSLFLFSLIKLRTLSLTSDLEYLWLEGCQDLEELHMPNGCPNLKSLKLENSNLRKINLGLTPDLEMLSLEGCCQLLEFHMPNEYPKLKYLSLNNSQLRSLNFRSPIGCPLQQKDPIEKLVFLDSSDYAGFKLFTIYKQLQSPVVSLHVIAESIDTRPMHSDSNLPEFRFSCLYGQPISSSIGNLGKLSVGLSTCTNLESFSESICNLQGLRKLISVGLSTCTNLESFSESICNLQGLRKLTLEGSIPEVPKDLDRLQSLEELSLLSTTIKHLPDNICMLKNLKLFELNSCWFLEKLPEDLGRLECLEDLNLTSCIRLQDIPNSICELKRLKCFNLSSCFQVKKLPREVRRLECLKELNIKDTGISDLPDGIFEIQGLHIVASDGFSCKVGHI